MRSVAIKKGYKLSEYGLFKVADDSVRESKEVVHSKLPELVHSEQDIFTLLDMEYKAPTDRNL